MIRSGSLDALTAALSAAQGEFEAVAKSASNPFFKSSYAPLPEVVKAATPILSQNGLSVWQGGDTDERGELLWTVVLHTSGQYIGSAARLLPVKGDPQAQGSAITYQRRYQYMAALGLVADEDDDGNAASSPRGATPNAARSRSQSRGRGNASTPPASGHGGAENGSDGTPGGGSPITPESLKEIKRLATEIGLTPARWKALAKEAGAEGKKSADLTEDEATWVVVKLTALAAKAAPK